MPDWKPHIRPLLVSLRLSPTREAEIVEELAQLESFPRLEASH